MINILIITLIVILIIASYYLIPDKKLLNSIFSYDLKNSPYSNKKFPKTNKLTFIPHPLTNWSLNPYYLNSKKEKVHTKEGFRKTCDIDSIIELNENSQGKFKIICVGSSSTQCQEMDDYRDTWPAILNKKLDKHNCQIFNFGVGAWTINQSLIRFINWSSIIKPNLVIFYQAKNELTPFYQGNQKEKYIYNDFQNVLGQYSLIFELKKFKFFLKLPIINIIIYHLFLRKKINQFGLLNIYKPFPDADFNGFERIKESNLESIFFKIKTFFKICELLNSKVLYIPELVFDNEYSSILKKEIFPKVKIITEEYKNVEYCDLYNVINYDKEKFIDKMHFSKTGSDVFSELLKNIILKKFL